MKRTRTMEKHMRSHPDKRLLSVIAAAAALALPLAAIAADAPASHTAVPGADAPASHTAVVAADAPAPSASLSPITPDRPGFTNGADIVLPGYTQLELGLARTDSPAGPSVIDYPQPLARHGLSPRLELRIGLPDYFRVNTGPRGLGDTGIGFKYQTYRAADGNTKLAVIAGISLPTGARAISSHHVDPAVTLAGQTTCGARWGLSSNLALSDPSGVDGRVFTVTPSVATSYQMTSRWSAYGDLYDALPQHGKPSPVADGGIILLANPNLQWDAEVGFGLGGAALTRFWGMGVSTRF